jgi:DNA-directed RNA polymerase subunit RPC12/RpoP
MIKFNCSSCQKKLGVPDEYAGRRVRCPKCEEPSIVPKVEATSAATSVTGSMADAVLSTSSSAPSETPV